MAAEDYVYEYSRLKGTFAECSCSINVWGDATLPARPETIQMRLLGKEIAASFVTVPAIGTDRTRNSPNCVMWLFADGFTVISFGKAGRTAEQPAL